MKLMMVGLVFAAIAVLPLDSRGQSQDSTKSQSTPADSAAAQAAERRKRFEEKKRRLEEAPSTGQPGINAGQTLFISPLKVSMVLGDVQAFSAFEIDGATVTHKALWVISNSSVAELSTRGEPTIRSKGQGTATLRAQLGSRYAEAVITVVSGTSLPMGSVRWSSGDIPGYKTTKISPAVPAANGPDVYEIAQNAQGDTLVRALMEDGRQLWMRYFSKGTYSGPLPGMPKSISPQ